MTHVTEASCDAPLYSEIAPDWGSQNPGIIPEFENAPRHQLLRGVLELERNHRLESALDLLYDRVSHLLRSGRFDQLDFELAQITVEETSTDILLGILTATLPGRGRLRQRPDFFETVQEALVQRGELEDGLLTGLEEFPNAQ